MGYSKWRLHILHGCILAGFFAAMVWYLVNVVRHVGHFTAQTARVVGAPLLVWDVLCHMTCLALFVRTLQRVE